MAHQFPSIGPSNVGSIVQGTESNVVSSVMERGSSGETAATTITASSQLISSGGVNLNVANKTSSFTASATEAFLYTCATGSGSITVTLPAASSSDGVVFAVKKTSASNSLIVDGASSETIDGAATLTATADDAALLFICDGTEWHTISRQGTWS